ncbi:MAG: FlgD immunoglobulin-like domain containing protein [Candidatus Krumholzibacteriia bacterium]
MIKLPLLLLVTIFLIAASALAADVEFSTTGAMDTPATLGGDRDGWGTDFITRWDNQTGRDVTIEEFGWPCGGWWSQFWYVWITDTLPEDPYTLEFHGSFVAASEDDTEWPPSLYTYVDVSGEGLVVPAGASMYFGYGNPGMGGQIGFNGVQTYSWLDDAWDMDGDFGRTAVMQFRGSFGTVAVDRRTPGPLVPVSNHPNPFNPSTVITFGLPRRMAVSLDVYSLLGRAVRHLQDGECDAGPHQVVWDGTDARGRSLPSGVYLARVTTELGTWAGKMVLAR